MCGHVGIAGKLEFKDEATMKRLLLVDYLRGPDSTGFAALRNNGDMKLVKLASHPIDLFDMKKFVDALSGYNSSVFLGHNRLATKGVINNYNAHPYEFDHIIGAHNGTLEKSSWDALEAALGEKYEVDSMAIIAAIAKLGIEATVPLLQGAWALVWINREDGTLNFLRNKERPFWFAYTKTFDRIFWASEWQTLAAAIDLAATGKDYDIHTEAEKGARFWSTQVDWWYRFDIEKLRAGATVRPKPRVKEVKGKEPVPAVTYNCGVSPFPRRTPLALTGPTNSTTKSSGKPPFVTSEVEPKSNVIQLTGSKDNPFGGYLSREEFDKIAKYGCSYCQADVEFQEQGVKVFMAQESVLCPSCAGGEDTRIYVGADRIVG